MAVAVHKLTDAALLSFSGKLYWYGGMNYRAISKAALQKGLHNYLRNTQIATFSDGWMQTMVEGLKWSCNIIIIIMLRDENDLLINTKLTFFAVVDRSRLSAVIHSVFGFLWRQFCGSMCCVLFVLMFRAILRSTKHAMLIGIEIDLWQFKCCALVLQRHLLLSWVSPCKDLGIGL